MSADELNAQLAEVTRALREAEKIAAAGVIFAQNRLRVLYQKDLVFCTTLSNLKRELRRWDIGKARWK